MARIDKRRAKGARPHAASTVKASPKRNPAAAVEDTMFFPRLRRHTKWMFVALALFFGLGFVIFGVGAGGTGIGNVFRGGGHGGGGGGGGTGGGGLSVGKALKETEKRPSDPNAWRDLSTAYQTKGKSDQAIAALVRYTQLAPKDPEGLRELGGLYLTQAQQRAQQAQLAQLRAAFTGAVPPPGVGLVVNGRTVATDPLARLTTSAANSRIALAASGQTSALQNAVAAYQRLAALSPKDPNTQFELGSNALQAGNTAVAIQAFSRFLRLAPDDPNAPIVRRQLKQLRASASGSTSGTTARSQIGTGG